MNTELLAKKVIGYFGSTATGDVFRNGCACVVAGELDDFHRYIKSLPGSQSAAIRVRKMRLGQIISDLDEGGEFAFDRPAFYRFHPLALRCGLEIPGELVAEAEQGKAHFVKVRLE